MSEENRHEKSAEEFAVDRHAADLSSTQEIGRNSGVWRLDNTTDAGTIRHPERIADSAKEAWEHPGRFYLEQDSSGRTQKIEGWLTLSDGARHSTERAIQSEVRKRERLGLDQDVGHIIGLAVGGPRADTHGMDLAKANQIAMDSRTNRSTIEGQDRQIRADLAAGTKIYVEASVKYDSSGKPEAVTYKYSVPTADGGRSVYGARTVMTRVDARPSHTTGEAVKNINAGTASDFYRHDRRGTARWEQ